MTDWRTFLAISGSYLRETNRCSVGEWSDRSPDAPRLKSWCSWTTYERLLDNAGYWTAELPLEAELTDVGTTDGGTWGQPFYYEQLAHLLIPRSFSEEHTWNGYFVWAHEQDIDGLSQRLHKAGMAHGLSAYALDIKLF